MTHLTGADSLLIVAFHFNTDFGLFLPGWRPGGGEGQMCLESNKELWCG